MIYRLLLLYILALFAYSANAQSAGVPPSGPVSASLGGVSSVLSNSWSPFNNPAGISSTEQITGVLGYQTSLNFSPFSTVSAGLTVPIKFGVGAFSVYRFGDDVFSNQMVGFTFAKKIGIMSLGIKASLLQYQIQDFGKRSIFTAEIGGIAELSPTLNFGAHIYNFTQSIIAVDSQEKIPTIIRLSIDYHPNEQLNLYVEGEKDIELTADLKFGLSYSIIENLILRTGFSTITNRHSFGAGLQLKRFSIDYGIQSNAEIGGSHNFGLTYELNE